MKAEAGRRRGKRERGHMEGGHGPERAAVAISSSSFRRLDEQNTSPLRPVGGADASRGPK